MYTCILDSENIVTEKIGKSSTRREQTNKEIVNVEPMMTESQQSFNLLTTLGPIPK